MAIRTGTAGNDKLWGTRWADTINGFGGNDYLNGRGGNDRMLGGDGKDKIDGGAGNDSMAGGNGIDALFGRSGNDLMYGDAGNDYLDGGSGNDTILGGLGDDRMRGGAGNDKFYTGIGGESDNIRGGAGNDNIIFETSGLLPESSSVYYGDAGTDTLTLHLHGIPLEENPFYTRPSEVFVSGELDGMKGFIQADTDEYHFGTAAEFTGIEKINVVNGSGTRLVYNGGDKGMKIQAADGNDALTSGTGADTFNGGEGRDSFYFDYGRGVDRIVGFNKDEDAIVTTMWEDSQGNSLANRTITETKGHTIVTTTSFDGKVLHTLDIDAVGLPANIFKDGFIWEPFV